MANYPCPVCGASHKYPPEKCRLCGQLMTEDAVVGDFEGARQVAQKRKGVFGIAGLIILGVIAAAALFVIFGVLPGRESVTGVASNIPGLQDRTKSGWVPMTDEDGGFQVSLPSQTPVQEEATVVLPAGEVTGTATRAWIGEDTLTEVVVVDDALPAGERAFDSLEDIRTLWEEQYKNDPTATMEDINETKVFGHPALSIKARNVAAPGQSDGKYHERTMVFFNDGRLYTISAFAVDPTSDAFDYMLSTFGLLDPAPPAGGTDATS
ncbi:MAG: hypothetical protein R2699_14715 [Acidimicrobiales bacterium]